MNFLIPQKIIPDIAYAILMAPHDPRFTENMIRKKKKKLFKSRLIEKQTKPNEWFRTIFMGRTYFP